MADQTVSSLARLKQSSANDYILIIDDPKGTPTSKKIEVGDLFTSALPSSVTVSNTAPTANADYVAKDGDLWWDQANTGEVYIWATIANSWIAIF